MNRTIVFWGLLLSFSVVACGDRAALPGQPDASSADLGSAPSDGEAPQPDLIADAPPVTTQSKVDILVVVDNSGSMEQEQTALAQNFDKLLDGIARTSSGMPCLLGSPDCDLPNLRVGVITTDLGAGNFTNIPTCAVGGDQGALQAVASGPCTPPSDVWLTYNAGAANVPAPGLTGVDALKHGFSCISKVGTAGCGFEQPLEAFRRMAQNSPEFFRPDAHLLVLIVTDEDDCSAADPQLFDPGQQLISDPLGPLSSFRCFEFGVHCETNGSVGPIGRTDYGPKTNCVAAPAPAKLWEPQRYVDLLATLKSGNLRAKISIIGGPTDSSQTGPDVDSNNSSDLVATEDAPNGDPTLSQSCSTALQGSASPAVRLGQVAAATGGTFRSICQPFSQTLAEIGAEF